MSRDPRGDFEQPKLPRGHSLCRHVLYRIAHTVWEAGRPETGVGVRYTEPS